MYDEIDIIKIDNEIQQKFKNKLNDIPKKLEIISKLQNTLNINNISNIMKQQIKNNIEELTKETIFEEIQNNYYIYIQQTLSLIEQYKEQLKKPIKMSFTNNKVHKNPELENIIQEYLSIIKHYDYKIKQKKKEVKITCDNCGKTNFDIVEDNIYICIDCGCQQEIILSTPSYKDTERINISSKYLYDRKIHFKDCINQYQGKQNNYVEQKIYDDLIHQFEKHHLLVGNKHTPKHIRYSKIDKTHIKLFLKELGHPEQYENINLLYYNITGIKPDDITYLEDKLLGDFDALIELYDKKYKNNPAFIRKNFINTQYVLYLLLCKHKHKCRKEDFAILKSQDRKDFHDAITLQLFNELEWSHISSF